MKCGRLLTHFGGDSFEVENYRISVSKSEHRIAINAKRSSSRLRLIKRSFPHMNRSSARTKHQLISQHNNKQIAEARACASRSLHSRRTTIAEKVAGAALKRRSSRREAASMALISRGLVFADLLQVGRSITRTLTTGRALLSQQRDDYVISQEDNGVRRLQLNHQKTRNALSLEMMSALLRGLATDMENPSLRSIVISAAPGKIFSAGHNLKELKTSEGEELHRAVFGTCAQLMKVIAECPVPVIAAVDGLAAAAGCQLIAACDIVVCTERSSFSTPGANVGIFCSTPGIPLVRNMPKKKASYMLFTGMPISAVEAYEAGLVSRIVPNDKLEDEITKITDAISEKSRSVVRLGKRFIREQTEVDVDTAYSLGVEVMVHNLKLKDAQEGIKSFSEKRRPSWTHTYDKDELF